ncbi:tRNA lysidine(34) synthetase TilS [Terasakiella sp. A23]|uniref:tRNA lysidine(34) synthetase TilS n=1 Tax=Terasakiella sp. FCG-A23 TaxID=3080561 RepID=UPI002953B810|nr:tRNA lysidine(34) synthetase TilS [Terasakiella sp. A23]MDV7339117.1 tRNA lysidine(34) synthetase TilS [Terasakiella sp. A23]
MQINLDDIADLGIKVCVAVSGGADSLALCLLAKDWADSQNRQIIAVSVDHGLRTESADECAWVAEILKNRGIEHHTLNWQGEKPITGIQAAARKARYDLMAGWCADHGVKDLLVAHHLDDQAETFLMRLARGSGVDGLSAMKSETTWGAVRILRPLLNVPKSDLEAYLRDQNQSWLEDPSNQNEDFDRVKVRQAMSMLSDIGLTPKRLSQTASQMQRVRKTLDQLTNTWLSNHARLFEEGYVLLNRKGLLQDEDEILLRGLSRIGQVVSGESYPPRLERLERVLKKLQSGEPATLMGCRWLIAKEDILICREIRNAEIPEKLYRLDEEESLAQVDLRILGEKGWTQVVKDRPVLKESTLPKPVILALPALWDEQGVSAVPHLDYKREDVTYQVELTFIPEIRGNS